VKRLLSVSVAVALAAAALTSCSSKGEDALVVYNAQHKQLIEKLAPAFEKETGIKVKLRNGSDLELASQLIAEGKASPADVFLTENSPAMAAVERKGLLAALPASVTDPIPAQFRPTSNEWTGFVARSTVLVYNTALVKESDLPASLMDLAAPQWKDRISFSPTGADFQAIVAGVLALEGEAKTKAWLEGLKANGTVYDGNNVVLESVNSGRSPVGIVYHYYWYRDQAESGEVSDHTKLHFFGNQDPGAFLSISGAGVLASSKHKSDAEEFVGFLTSKAGQQDLADSYALEYPLNPEVQLAPPVKPFAELQPPPVAVSDLDSDKVVDLMTQVGFL
jgi:iron(III) transport system substrate-binding protein